MSEFKRSGHSPAYKNALKAISARTGTPLPSLLVSFGILHELTAIIPLVGIFYGARALGVGERVVAAVMQDGFFPAQQSRNPKSESISGPWVREQCKSWVREGEDWAGRVGRRYGIFGFEKRTPGSASDTILDDNAASTHVSGEIAGDVANAIVAYGVTKALIPLRIGVSLYLSPVFSRRIVEPSRKGIFRMFRRGS